MAEKKQTPEERIEELENEVKKAKSKAASAASPADWNVEFSKGCRTKVTDKVKAVYEKKKKLGNLKFKTIK